MSDKITKFLRKLSRKEYRKVVEAIECIVAGELATLDVKALKGHKNHYRIRVGRIRIIIEQIDGLYELVSIVNRDEQTYKNL